MTPVTVCRVSRLTVMEVTRNVPPLQVRQVEAYEKRGPPLGNQQSGPQLLWDSSRFLTGASRNAARDFGHESKWPMRNS